MFDQKLTTCPVCPSQDLRHFLTDHRGINIDVCSQCNLLFMNPRYSDAHLDDFYAQYTELEDRDNWNEALAYGHGFHLARLEAYRAPGTFLDIGCGNGHLLAAAQRRGWQVTGQDVSVTSCGKVSQRLGVEVLCGDFLSMEFDRRFDGISMHQVLEHVKDPWSFVEKIHSLLNPGGVFFVATPNIWSLSNRLKYSYERMGLRKSEIGKYFDSSHHLNYFTPKAMNRLLSRADFTIKAARNGHKVRPGQSRLQRFLMRNITERFVPRSTFFVIAQK